MTGLFITATGTDIGKTYVTAGITRAGRQSGYSVSAIKPLMSGYDERLAADSDAGMLLDAMGRPVNPETIAAIAPWRYSAPLSPDIAALRENRSINFDEILVFCRAAILAAPDLILIEGVGGAMVPLDGQHTVRDWIAKLGLPAILVAGSYLGTISHTLAAAEALLARGVTIAAIVISESETSPMPPEDTASTMQKFLPGTAIHIIPRHRNDQAFAKLMKFARTL